ncbi:MAG TPA: aldehyde ferredoxin oxidoreductase C-terminal domain-containing protein, partial [Verrucomicrobiae bacterium]|nr:aldehyde ferredoxin oxidoreductase C-terminal domain-containing protein [Verrucomicrobiae bacterium]
MKDYPDSGVIAIGAAGENLVRFSLAITDNTSTLGRNGLGAVFGSKNLKAVVTRGSQGVNVKDPKRLLRLVGKIHKEILAHPGTKPHQEIGLHANWEVYRNTMNPGIWSQEKWNQYYGPEVAKSAIFENLPCTGCLLGCRSTFKFDTDVENNEITYTGTFLHLANIGQVSGLTRWQDAAVILHRCNQVGMSVVEFRGIIRYLSLAAADHPEVKALRLEEGLPAYQRLLDLIISRRGIGEVLANGWAAMAEAFGSDPGQYLSLVKGAACTYDARATKLDAVRFHIVVNPRGAMHGQGHSTTSVPLREPEDIIQELKRMGLADQDIKRIIDDRNLNVGRLTRHVQDSGMVMDSLGVCIMYNIPGFLHLDNLSEIYSAVTGLETSPGDLKQSGERSFNLLKTLNARAGFGRADDTFPQIWLQPKNTPDGIEYLDDYYRNKHLSANDLEQILTDYYEERGWDPKSGLPYPQTVDKQL